MTKYDQALAEYRRTGDELYALNKDLMAACSPFYIYKDELNEARKAHDDAWDALRAAKRIQA